MNPRKPEFRLISCTRFPIETLYAVWAQSRPSQFKKLFDYIKYYTPIVSAEDVRNAISDGIIEQADVEKVCMDVIKADIPVSECIHFTWGFSSLPIEWREQAVRKRQWGFWLTSMREFSMEDFVTDGRYALPPFDASSSAIDHEILVTLELIQDSYRRLIELGAPQEVARKVIPLCATHNGSMFSNLRTLMDTVKSRSCWIAQLGLWEPVLRSIVVELTAVNPILGNIVSPPCFNKFSNEFHGCKYELINENRTTGENDPYAPCPLYLCNKFGVGPDTCSTPIDSVSPAEFWTAACDTHRTNRAAYKYIVDSVQLLNAWSSIWNRNPFTGEIRE